MGNRSTKTLRVAVGSAMTKSPRLNEIPPNERNGETQTLDEQAILSEIDEAVASYYEGVE